MHTNYAMELLSHSLSQATSLPVTVFVLRKQSTWVRYSQSPRRKYKDMFHPADPITEGLHSTIFIITLLQLLIPNNA